MTPIQFSLTALGDKVDKLDEKMDKRSDQLEKRLETFVNAVHERFNGLEKLVRDTHSENGRNRGAND